MALRMLVIALAGALTSSGATAAPEHIDIPQAAT